MIKFKNGITFKILTEHFLELFRLETVNLLEDTEMKITKDKTGENVQRIEINKQVLVHCNIVNNQYRRDSRVLYSFVSHRSFGQLLTISPKKSIYKETFHFEFSYMKIKFSDKYR